MKFNWNLKTKLILLMLALAVVPMLTSNIIAYHDAAEEVEKQAEERVHMIGADKAHALENYIKNESKSLEDFSTMDVTKEHLRDLSNAFAEFSKTKLSDAELENLQEFYNREFSKKYSDTNDGKKFDAETYIKTLSPGGLVLQHDYIAANPNALGEKHKLKQAKRPSSYSSIHASMHKEYARLLEKHGLYDVFLINASGDIVYSVYKEIDFGTNLSKGPLSQSGLGLAWAAAMKHPEGLVHTEDYKPYMPSFEAAASFLSAPLIENGETIGVMAFQLPIDRITSIVLNRKGLGETGQTILIGDDGRLRADAHIMKETYNVKNSFKEGSNLVIKSEALELAKQGKTGALHTTNFLGHDVLAYYSSIQIDDVKWYMVTELQVSEVLAGLASMRNTLFILLGVSSLLAGLIAWFFGNSIASSLGKVISRLSASNHQVSSASHESAAAATELSEAATEQAASLQETMASVEEISAMVNQNAESASKAKSAVENNAKTTEDGKKSVSEMIQAIGEIKETNDEILTQMENSNKEFTEIVKIISNIGEKTKVINDIVFQTKLLSFNASVEAARAGEHGKGFAVVAEEVGNLAAMSGNAAREISEMLSESIKKVNDIVEQTTAKVDQLVEIGKDKISMGQSTANRCSEALDAIATNAKSVSMMVTEIANASKEQSQGVQEINKAISQLDQVTQQNSAVAQQSSAQAESLNAQAQELSNAVNDLVAFVEGTKQKIQESSERHNREHLVEKSSIKESSVVSLNTHRESKKSSVVSEQERSLMAKVKKKASGDETPGSDHPDFEEF